MSRWMTRTRTLGTHRGMQLGGAVSTVGAILFPSHPIIGATLAFALPLTARLCVRSTLDTYRKLEAQLADGVTVETFIEENQHLRLHYCTMHGISRAAIDKGYQDPFPQRARTLLTSLENQVCARLYAD